MPSESEIDAGVKALEIQNTARSDEMRYIVAAILKAAENARGVEDPQKDRPKLKLKFSPVGRSNRTMLRNPEEFSTRDIYLELLSGEHEWRKAWAEWRKEPGCVPGHSCSDAAEQAELWHRAVEGEPWELEA